VAFVYSVADVEKAFSQKGTILHWRIFFRSVWSFCFFLIILLLLLLLLLLLALLLLEMVSFPFVIPDGHLHSCEELNWVPGIH